MEDVPAPESVEGVLGEPIDARLDRWVADGRVDEVAKRRSTERELRQQAEESGVFAGVLMDLGERRASVEVRLVSGRKHTGTIERVGLDFVTLRVAGAGEVHVALRAVMGLVAASEAPRSLGDRNVGATTPLSEMVVALAAEHSRALVVSMSGNAPVYGTVETVGQDLVTLSLDSGGTAYLPLHSVAEVFPRL